MRERRRREAQAREAKLERRQPVESPGGGALLTGLLDDLHLPCEHGRPSWRMCPHCNGWNTPDAAAARERVMLAIAQPDDGLLRMATYLAGQHDRRVVLDLRRDQTVPLPLPRWTPPARCPHHDICDHSLTCDECRAEGGPGRPGEEAPRG